MREPAFWWQPGTGGLLEPLAAIYGAVAAARMGLRGQRAGVPVICLGNLTVGGAGKTPAALAVAHLLHAAHERPFFLTPRLWRPARRAGARQSRGPSLGRRRRRTAIAGAAGTDHRRARSHIRRAICAISPARASSLWTTVSESGARQRSCHCRGRRPPRHRQRPRRAGGSAARAAANTARSRARAHRRSGRRTAPLISKIGPRKTAYRSFMRASNPIAASSPPSAAAKCWPSPASAIRINSSRP